MFVHVCLLPVTKGDKFACHTCLFYPREVIRNRCRILERRGELPLLKFRNRTWQRMNATYVFKKWSGVCLKYTTDILRTLHGDLGWPERHTHRVGRVTTIPSYPPPFPLSFSSFSFFSSSVPSPPSPLDYVAVYDICGHYPSFLTSESIGSDSSRVEEPREKNKYLWLKSSDIVKEPRALNERRHIYI